jgi:hypothetical protein
MKPKPLPLAIAVPAERIPVSDEWLRSLMRTPPGYRPDPSIQTFSEAGLRGWVFTVPPSEDPEST